MRELIGFDCTKCRRQNYTSDKNKKKTTGKTGKIELKKYCAFCRSHTPHKEAKVAK